MIPFYRSSTFPFFEMFEFCCCDDCNLVSSRINFCIEKCILIAVVVTYRWSCILLHEMATLLPKTDWQTNIYKSTINSTLYYGNHVCIEFYRYMLCSDIALSILLLVLSCHTLSHMVHDQYCRSDVNQG